MSRTTIPARVLLHPLTGEPIHPLGYRADGRAIWPILGGAPKDDEGDDDDPDDDDPDGGDDDGQDDDEGGQGKGGKEKDVAYWEAEVAKWKAASRKHEGRAKRGTAAERELAKLKREGMTEAEAAIAKAREEARAEARSEFGGKLVEAQIRGRAAGRLDDDALDSLIEGIDTARFLDDDGDVDAEKLRAWVDKVAPRSRRRDGDEDEDKGGRGNGARGGAGMGQGRGRKAAVTGMAAGASRYEERKARLSPSKSA